MGRREVKLFVDIDPSKLVARTERQKKRFAYVVSKSLNESALKVEQAERVQLDRKFEIRRAGFMYRLIKITQFSNPKKTLPFAEIAIDNTKARVLLPIFEEGGPKDPVKGKNVAVPVTGQSARPAFSDLVPDEFTFRKLGFRRQNLTKAGKLATAAKKKFGIKGRLTPDYFVWAGKERTFILPSTKKHPQGGVFQRVGPKKDDIRMIYSFRPKPRLKAVLKYVATARRTFEDNFEQIFERNWQIEFGKD